MAAPTPGTIPIPYYYQGHTYWLQPSGQWTNGQSASSNKVSGSIVQALQAGSGTATNNPTGGPPIGDGTQPSQGTPDPVPGSGITTPATTAIPDVMAPGYGTISSRFGDYTLDPYLLASGTGSASTAAPVPAVPSAAPGAPAGNIPPAVGGGAGGVPAGAGVPPTVPPAGGTALPPATASQAPAQGQGGMFGGNPGNAGGAQQADRGGMFGRSGGNSGFGGQAQASGNGAAGNGMLGGTTGTGGAWPSIDLGPWGAGALSTAATLAPGWAGAGLGALQAAMRGYNTMSTNTVRGAQGIPDTDFGQFLGSILGLNDYGALNGNRTIANTDQYGDLQRRIDSQQLGNDPFADFFRTNVTGAPMAETDQGGIYASGPSIFGWHPFGGSEAAMSVQGTNDQLSGMEAVKQLAAEAGISLAQAQAMLDRDKPGNAAGGSILGAVRNPGSSGASTTTGAAGVRGIGAGNLAPLSAKAQAELDRYNAMNGYDASGKASSGFTGNNGSQTGMGGNGFSGNLSAGIGNAVSAGGTGGLQNGFGGGGYAEGGYVRGRPDAIPDNRLIAANEGEYVIKNAAARKAGRKLLGMLNTPAGAARLRGMLG